MTLDSRVAPRREVWPHPDCEVICSTPLPGDERWFPEPPSPVTGPVVGLIITRSGGFVFEVLDAVRAGHRMESGHPDSLQDTQGMTERPGHPAPSTFNPGSAGWIGRPLTMLRVDLAALKERQAAQLAAGTTTRSKVTEIIGVPPNVVRRVGWDVWDATGKLLRTEFPAEPAEGVRKAA